MHTIYHHNSIHYYGHLLEGDRLKVLDENAANEDIDLATGMVHARGDAVAFRVPRVHHKVPPFSPCFLFLLTQTTTRVFVQIAYSFINNNRTVRILGPQEMRGQHIVMGFIRRLLRFKGNKFTTWAELEVFTPSRSKCNSFLSLQRGPCIYVPLGWHGWTVARQVFLMPHPTKATHVIFNHRFEWVITDLWPGEICKDDEVEGSDRGDD